MTRGIYYGKETTYASRTRHVYQGTTGDPPKID